MAEQRRLRRQLESFVARTTPQRHGQHRGHHRLPALRTALGRPRLPVDAAHQPDEAHDWSRQTIVSEAVAEYYPLVGYSTCTPPEDWSRACLEPILEADGAVPHSGQPFNAPKEGDPDSSAYSRYLGLTLRGRPGHGWLLLLERYGAAAAPASPWTDFDRELLEDSASVLGMALENNLLSAQSAERASYLTNMLNSLDVAVMVIEQPPAPVPAVVSLVNRSFCELFGLEHAQVEANSYLQFMDLVRPILPDWDAQLAIIEDLLADPTAERIDEITLVPDVPDAVPTHLHRFATPARDAHGQHLRADVLFPRHHLRQGGRAPACPFAEDGQHRHAGGRRRARFQQPADHDPGLRGVAQARAEGQRIRQPEAAPDRKERQPRGRVDRPAPGLQPAASDGAARLQRQRPGRPRRWT